MLVIDKCKGCVYQNGFGLCTNNVACVPGHITPVIPQETLRLTEARLAAATAQLDKSRANFKSLQVAHERTKRTLDATRNKLDGVRKAHEALQASAKASADAYQQHLGAKDKRIAELEEFVNAATTASNDHALEVQRLTQQLRDIDRVKNSKSELAPFEVVRVNHQLADQLAAKDKQIAELEATVERMGRLNAEHLRQLYADRCTIKKTNELLDTQNTVISSLQSQVEAKDRTIEKLQGRLDAVKEAVAELITPVKPTERQNTCGTCQFMGLSFCGVLGIFVRNLDKPTTCNTWEAKQ